jgi:hypothetical protein
MHADTRAGAGDDRQPVRWGIANRAADVSLGRSGSTELCSASFRLKASSGVPSQISSVAGRARGLSRELTELPRRAQFACSACGSRV